MAWHINNQELIWHEARGHAWPGPFHQLRPVKEDKSTIFRPETPVPVPQLLEVPDGEHLAATSPLMRRRNTLKPTIIRAKGDQKILDPLEMESTSEVLRNYKEYIGCFKH
jgi:hypothetical protein